MKAVTGIYIAVAFLLAGAGPAASAAAAAPPPPAVVVTLKPLHSLVAGVMRGVGTPTLLIDDAGDPRTLDLARRAALARARILFWLDPRFEPVVAPLVRARKDGLTVIALMRVSGVRLMDARPGHRRTAAVTARPPVKSATAKRVVPELKDGNIVFRKRGAPVARSAPAPAKRARAPRRAARGPAPVRIATPDPHVWLDPRNAIAIVRAVAATLAKADPANASRYSRNAAVLIVRIEALNDSITAATRPVRHEHYAITNNALQYFEDQYLMAPALEFRLSSARPDAKTIAADRRRLAASGIRCLFAPEALDDASGRALIAGTKARLVQLDTIGRTVAPGPDAYFAIIRGIGGRMSACLRRG